LENDELRRLEDEERALLEEINKVDQVVVRMRDEYDRIRIDEQYKVYTNRSRQ
jgi:hypothetical protein